MHLLRSVLSDLARRAAKQDAQNRLNVSFGAWCFLTLQDSSPGEIDVSVLMHRLALGAF